MTAVMTGEDSDTHVGAAIAASLVLHAGCLAAWLYLNRKGPETQVSVITDVDILMASPQARAAAAAVPKPSMKDFLRMALPSIPKVHEPLNVAAPELKHDLLQIPQMKMQDRGRLRDPSKMEALDLGKHKMDLAKVDQPLEDRHAKATMEMPKLEEIGTRRAPAKVLRMAALEEASRERAPVGLSGLAPSLERRRAPSAAPLLPAEASTGKPSALSKMADMLTSDSSALKLQPRAMPAKRLDTLSSEPEVQKPKRTVDLASVKRKAVEIEGPLSNRKVRAYSLPQFPQWAKDQGIVEADLAIHFDVDPEGNVVEDTMRVERSSGYGRLDRLALENLKHWRFEPLAAGTGNQWGVITFRFVLE